MVQTRVPWGHEPLLPDWTSAVCTLHPRANPVSIQSVPLSPKPNTTILPSLPTHPLPLDAFPTQSDRRGGRFPGDSARIRGSSRGFSANQRGSGLPAEGQVPPSPLRLLTLAAWCPPRGAGGLAICVHRLLPATGSLAALSRCDEQKSELLLYNWCWVGWGERFRDRGVPRRRLLRVLVRCPEWVAER